MFEQIPDPFSFYQLVGWIAVTLYLVSFQFLNPRQTILIWIPANTLMAVHYFGLGSYTACAIALGAILRDIAVVFGPKKFLLMVIMSYILYVWIIALNMSFALHDYLITIGTTFTGFASLNRDHFWRHRLFSALQQIFLLYAFILMGSYPGIFNIITVMCSNAIGVYRKIKQDHKQQEL